MIQGTFSGVLKDRGSVRGLWMYGIIHHAQNNPFYYDSRWVIHFTVLLSDRENFQSVKSRSNCHE